MNPSKANQAPQLEINFSEQIHHQTPEGFYTILKSEIPERVGERENESICHFCHARSLCVSNKNGWTVKNPCTAYRRDDGRGVIFRKKTSQNS